MSREWYRFFINLYTLTGTGTSDTSIVDLAIQPAFQDAESANPNLGPETQLASIVAKYDDAMSAIQGAYESPAAIPFDAQLDPLAFCAPSPSANSIVLTGDVTGSGYSSIPTTLASIITAGGPTGSATVAPVITYDAKGRLTAVSSATVTPAVGSITGLGANVATFLATPSSANLAAALTDETGTGAAVFANTPTLVTPTLGAANATSINFGGTALSTYQQGTFTPTAYDAVSAGNQASYSTQEGVYTKIGNICYFRFVVALSSVAGMTGGNAMFFRGFPFVAETVSGGYYIPCSVIANGVTYTGTLNFNVASGQQYGYLYKTVSAAGSDSITVTNISGTAFICVSGCYKTV